MTKISADDVELFLLENPDFFLKKQSLVNELNFHDAPDGVSSLLEKQIEHLREEKTKLLVLKFGLSLTLLIYLIQPQFQMLEAFHIPMIL